ncbi:MAG: glycosyltransferase [Alphaproteobacteria bacterium]
MDTIKALWIGPEIGAIEQMSLLSFRAAGHPVELFVYEPVRGVPDEITLRDGRDILPEDRIVRHSRSGSPALFSDFFRFAVVAREGGIWADTDVIALQALGVGEPYLFGREDHRLINCAIYRAPPASELALFLADQALNPRRLPGWASRRSLSRVLGGWALGQYRGVADAPWGMYGPELLTAAIRKFGLESWCQDSDVFYPIGTKQVRLFFGPEEAVWSCLAETTRAIHLWRAELKDSSAPPFPEGSFMNAMARRFL